MDAYSFRSSLLGFTLLAAACGNSESIDAVETARPPITNYTRQTNGTGIHIASTQPESWLGLSATSTAWFSNGFAQRADGSWVATGWYSIDLLLISADAAVVSAQVGGTPYTLAAIRTTGSQLSLDLRDSQGRLQTLAGASLVGVTLQLAVPDQLGITTSRYNLRISSTTPIDSQFGDVAGYQIDYQPIALLPGSWSSYCKGSDGSSQRAVFYQGSQWNPLNAARTDGENLVTMTCESGSVAKCLRGGYRPWGSGSDGKGNTVSLADHHQACIHMKRASYCGNSTSYTIDGTALFLRDQLNPAIWAGSLDTVEAQWTPTGATCISNRRHPELPFLGCAQPLPPRPTTLSASALIASGLATDGALLSVRD